MLDEDDRQAVAAQRLYELDADAELAGAQPGQPFVEQQQLGVERQGPRQLQPLLVDIGELAGRHIGAGREPDPGEQLEGALAGRLTPKRVGPEGKTGEHVVEAAQRPQHADQLEGPCDTQARDVMGCHPGDRLAFEADVAAVRLERARDQVERRRLAGAVRTDHTEDLAGHDGKLDIVDRHQSAERLADPGKLEQSRTRHLAGAVAGAERRRAGSSARDQSGDAVGQEIDDHDEDDAQHDREIVRQVDGDQFCDEDQRHDAEQGSEEAPRPAEQGHDHHLEGDHRIEGDRRVDIGPARRHHRAGRRHEGGAYREQDQLGRRGVDRDMAGDQLVIADDPERQAEARSPDRPTDDQHQGRQPEELPIDRLLAGRQEDVAADGAGDVDLVPDDKLAGELGEAEGEDDEVDAAETERRQADDQRHGDADQRRHCHHARPGHGLGKHRHGVGADAEERRGRQRNVARRTGEQCPGGGEHRIAHQVDGERQPVGVDRQRHRGQNGEDDDEERRLPKPGGAHCADLPNNPVGRIIRTPRKST